MNTFNIKENCKEIKARFIKQFANLSEEDLWCENGRKEVMMNRLQQKLGKSEEELHSIILKL